MKGEVVFTFGKKKQQLEANSDGYEIQSGPCYGQLEARRRYSEDLQFLLIKMTLE